MRFDAERRSLFATRTVERSLGLPVFVEPSPSAWQPGELVHGRYLVLAQIGEGGMGRVYHVRDVLHPERSLALKTLAPSHLPEHRVELFKAEFRTMASLVHPNIAAVHDFERIGGVCAFTMELVDGSDLLLASDGRSTEDIVGWMVQACRALQYLHSRGVVHADFKPHNVILTATGQVKVLDFGLSGGVGGGLVLGTPAYMAPELLSGQRADPRIDLYALGITLYQLLCRTLPFGGRDAHEVMAQHASVPLGFPADTSVDEGLRRVIARLCAKAPADRYTDANEVIDALARAMGRAYEGETSETQRSYLSARLVGRVAEQEALVAYGLRAGAVGPEEPTLATVSGPSGVGKSRLVAEVRRQLQLAGLTFVDASCWEGGAGELTPLSEWTEALCAIAGAHHLHALVTQYQPTLDWLRAVAPAPTVRSLVEDESLRMLRLCELADFMLDLSESVGLVLHLDDLQWGRSSMTDFLRRLCERQIARREVGRAVRLAVVVSYRDDEVAGPLAELLAAVKAESRLGLSISPLSTTETSELVESMLGSHDPPLELAERLSQETGGNPFFIEELLRVLMERGDVCLEAGRWTARTAPRHLELPTSIAATLERRVAAITPRERDALSWLAVYAQPMPKTLLASAGGVSVADTEHHLRGLVDRQLVTEVGPDRVRLAHDKLREFLYHGEAVAARRIRHARIAEVLDQLARSDDELVFERAHHHWYADDARAARHWCKRAAALGERSFAVDAAIDNYHRLSLLADQRSDEDERREATDRLLALCTIAGQYDRVLTVTTAELGRRHGRLERARLVQQQGEALGLQGKLVEGIERLRDATVLVGGAVPRNPRLRRVFIVAHFARHVLVLRLRPGPLVRPSRLSDERRVRNEILATCYFLMSIYAMLSGDDDGVGLSFAGINAALPLGPHPIARRLLQNVALGHHVLGRYRDSERLIREAQALASTATERASLLPTEVLALQLTQRPLFAGQRSVQAQEPEILAAVEQLSTRSNALYANLARSVATTCVLQFADHFRYRPELFRWAEAMRGTIHYGFVQGGAAVMALVDGQKRRAHEAFARAQESTTPFYRAFVGASFAYTCAIVGETDPALACLRATGPLIVSMQTRISHAQWVLSFCLGTALVLEARGVAEPALRGWVHDGVERLDRLRHRLPASLLLVHEAGRLSSGRSSLAALQKTKEASHQSWSRAPTVAGHLDGCVLAALALRMSKRSDCQAAAAGWAVEALQLVSQCYPPGYTTEVAALLGVKLPS